jgi:photosystem II stability/assembly factor-like uncharacterized protein
VDRHLEGSGSGRTCLRWALALLCGLLWVFAPQPARAQESLPHWYPLAGPAGRISRLAAAPNGDLYAVSVTGVNRRDDQTQWRESGSFIQSQALYRSEDGGATWQPVTNDLPPGQFTALAVDDAGGDILVGLLGAAADQRSPLWRSSDGGLHWAPLSLPVTSPPADGLIIHQIARSADGRYLFLGATAGDASTISYVYRSGDDGRTWTTYEVLRNDQQPGDMLADLIPHPARGDRLFITTYAGDVLISEDAGQNWRSVAQRQAGTEAGVTPPQLAFRADRPDVALLVRGQDAPSIGALAVESSNDGGLTWRAVAASGLPAQGAPLALAALPGGVYLLNTSTGTYRSADGGVTWQPLEGALSSGGVAEFLASAAAQSAAAEPTVLAATGHGVYVSRDGGAVWEPLGTGLPFNSKIAGLLTHSASPGTVFAVSDNASLGGTVQPPLILRSLDAGQRWASAAAGLPDAPVTAWTIDPSDPNVLLAASSEQVFRSSDAGLSWQATRLESGAHKAIAVATSDSNVVYLGGRPALRSADLGVTWEPMPVVLPGEQQTQDVSGIVVAPNDAGHLWAGLDGGGVLESRDAGRSWRSIGLAGQPVRWLTAGVAQKQAGAMPGPAPLYAGVAEDGIYRLDGNAWTAVSDGLPARSTILALVVDPRVPGLLWAAREGGGVYRSTDGGDQWENVALGVGENLAQTLAVDFSVPDGVLMGTATAGVWALRPNVQPAAKATAVSAVKTANGRAGVDARIEVVWPHDFAPVTEADQANIGLRLFVPGSLTPPACGWQPKTTVWQAANTDPVEPLDLAEQRSVDGQPFPYWNLNDVDVSRAKDPSQKLYFMVRVEGVDTATSVWAHGADPRTYFPQPDVPSGTATDGLDAVDARIQIVWPHDEAGSPRSVREGALANVLVTFFKHGTRVSVPVDWQPTGLTLYGAWDQEVGKPLSSEAVRSIRQAGAIGYPVWEFDNIPVARATTAAGATDETGATLYLWVMADGVQTYPNIWAHGADSRTYFPAMDEPIQGCVP